MREMRPVRPGWFNAFRPWTLHGAVVPVMLGGVIAYGDGHFNLWIFLLVLAGGCLLQSASNLLNTYGDFVKGTDTVENSLRSPELVTGALRPRSVLLAGLGCLVLTALIGLVLIWHIGWGILLFGIAGIFGAAFYTVGVSYKYRGMGLISVFVLMGLLMPMGTYYSLSGSLSWEVLWASIPNALLITAVLSGNETRDYLQDRETGVGTFSSRFSYRFSLGLYIALCSAPFPVLVVLVASGALPWPCLLAMAALPMLRSTVLNALAAAGDRPSNMSLVPMAFTLNWVFGALLISGYIIAQQFLTGAIYV